MDKDNNINQDLIDRIELLKPSIKEAIVLHFDTNKVPIENIFNICKFVKSKFPDNIVMGIPNVEYLETCSKDVLENYISMISEIIEKL